MITVVRRIMVTIVVATMAGACISGVRTTYDIRTVCTTAGTDQGCLAVSTKVSACI